MTCHYTFVILHVFIFSKSIRINLMPDGNQFSRAAFIENHLYCLKLFTICQYQEVSQCRYCLGPAFQGRGSVFYLCSDPDPMAELKIQNLSKMEPFRNGMHFIGSGRIQFFSFLVSNPDKLQLDLQTFCLRLTIQSRIRI